MVVVYVVRYQLVLYTFLSCLIFYFLGKNLYSTIKIIFFKRTSINKFKGTNEIHEAPQQAWQGHGMSDSFLSPGVNPRHQPSHLLLSWPFWSCLVKPGPTLGEPTFLHRCGFGGCSPLWLATPPPHPPSWIPWPESCCTLDLPPHWVWGRWEPVLTFSHYKNPSAKQHAPSHAPPHSPSEGWVRGQEPKPEAVTGERDPFPGLAWRKLLQRRPAQGNGRKTVSSRRRGREPSRSPVAGEAGGGGRAPSALGNLARGQARNPNYPEFMALKKHRRHKGRFSQPRRPKGPPSTTLSPHHGWRCLSQTSFHRMLSNFKETFEE